jgi:hypothetical protein
MSKVLEKNLYVTRKKLKKITKKDKNNEITLNVWSPYIFLALRFGPFTGAVLYAIHKHTTTHLATRISFSPFISPLFLLSSSLVLLLEKKHQLSENATNNSTCL